MEKFSRAWYAQMVRIWQDRITYWGAVSTGALRQSVAGGGLTVSEAEVQAEFRFLRYGIYVDAGTGKGYRPGNGGNLEFKDKDYRRQHRLGRTRERRPWFSVSWAISRRVFADRMAAILGDKFAGAIATLSNRE